MIIAYAFIKTLGTPDCVSMANQTAQQLSLAINEVADGTNVLPFQPSDPSMNEPADSRYYTTVPIRLCQQYGTYNFFLTFLGGMPEYQIYYEKFPEGGGGMWNEAYPWSGGAASSLVFWAGMRGITLGLKGAWKLTKIYQGWKTAQLAYKGLDIAKERVSFFKYLTKTSEFEDLIADKVDEFVSQGRLVSTLTDEIGEADSEQLLKYLGDAGFIDTITLPNGDIQYFDDAGKIVIRNDVIPATVVERVQDQSGNWLETPKKIVVFVQPDGTLDWNEVELLGMTDSVPNGYQEQMINPREQMKNLIESLKESGQVATAQQLSEDFEVDINGVLKTFDELDKPNFLKRISNAVKKQWTEMKDYLKKYLYLGDSEEFATESGDEVLTRARAAEELAGKVSGDTDYIFDLNGYGTFVDSNGNIVQVTADNFREDVIGPMLKSEDYGKNLIKKVRHFAGMYGIPISPEVTPHDALVVMGRIWEENGGGLAIEHESSFGRFFNRIRDAIKLTNGDGALVGNLPAGGSFTPSLPAGGYTEWLTEEVKKLPNYNKWFSSYEGRITTIGGELQSKYLGLAAANPLLTPEQLGKLFDGEVEKFQWQNLVTELVKNDKGVQGLPRSTEFQEMIDRQLGMLIGIMDKDYNALPVDLGRAFGIKYAGKQASKMLFIDGTALVAPNSWIAKGLILGQMTKGCRGNSICLYVQASQAEAPYYMDLNATNYTVRVWRPVEPWKQWVGWQAALQHVPAHPRFYVVSPCFAVAKVWKTNLDGKQTIFVHPIKVDMKGKNSNYCYADSDLVNAYTTIWAVSDAATIITTVMSLGVKSATTGAKLVLKNILDKSGMADPVTFLQCIAEGAIGWPGAPYTGMNYTDILENTGNVQAFNELQAGLKSAYG